MTLDNHPTHSDWLKLLCLTVMATLAVEHSQFDIWVSQLFYSNGHWLLDKDAQPYVFIFYDLPKLLLILLGITLITVLIWRYVHSRRSHTAHTPPFFMRPIVTLSSREISYLLITIIMVPTVIATLKSLTHVSCPNHLYIFNGDLPYLNIWQNILAKTSAKCFPAAHASAGFALYGFAYLPSLQRHRGKIIITVTLLGWIMGLYKMSFGDHFFSHTLVSMLLAWTIACALATLFFGRMINNKTKKI